MVVVELEEKMSEGRCTGFASRVVTPGAVTNNGYEPRPHQRGAGVLIIHRDTRSPTLDDDPAPFSRQHVLETLERTDVPFPRQPGRTAYHHAVYALRVLNQASLQACAYTSDDPSVRQPPMYLRHVYSHAHLEIEWQQFPIRCLDSVFKSRSARFCEAMRLRRIAVEQRQACKLHVCPMLLCTPAAFTWTDLSACQSSNASEIRGL